MPYLPLKRGNNKNNKKLPNEGEFFGKSEFDYFFIVRTFLSLPLVHPLAGT
jgi:hypothetical protein